VADFLGGIAIFTVFVVMLTATLSGWDKAIKMEEKVKEQQKVIQQLKGSTEGGERR